MGFIQEKGKKKLLSQIGLKMCIRDSYRKAIDLYYEDPENYKLPQVLLDEMFKVSHRQYHTGFFFNEPNSESQIYNTNDHVREYDVVAIVYDYDENTKIATCKQRNKFVKGDNVEILSPSSLGESFVVEDLYNEEGEEMCIRDRIKGICRRRINSRI